MNDEYQVEWTTVEQPAYTPYSQWSTDYNWITDLAMQLSGDNRCTGIRIKRRRTEIYWEQ